VGRGQEKKRKRGARKGRTVVNWSRKNNRPVLQVKGGRGTHGEKERVIDKGYIERQIRGRKRMDMRTREIHTPQLTQSRGQFWMGP